LEAGADTYEVDFCLEVVYVSSELGESIDNIMQWTIVKFNIVSALINRINKLKYSDNSKGNFKGKSFG